VIRGDLTSAQLERGHVYRCVHGNPFADGEAIKIESIGPKTVRYRGWTGAEWSSRIERHPRVLFDSWDGAWIKTEDPST
jgi:hypothetical protein